MTIVSKEGIKKQMKGLPSAILAAVFIRIFVLDNFYVPTGSMIPTILIWDHLFASKWDYGYSKHVIPFSPNLFEGRIFYTPPKRGEIVIFERPNDEKRYVKRVIGLPGETIQIKDGVLHINDVSVVLEKIEDYTRLDPNGNQKIAAQYIETLPEGLKHRIIRTKGTTETSYKYIVPKNHFFMMGDNRDESGDSRHQEQMGYIHEDYIKSKAQFVWFSTDGSAGWWEFWKWVPAIRWGRFFNWIR
jgi:signal peptidase I